MTRAAVWHAFKLPLLIAAVTAWSLIAALFSDGWLERLAVTLIAGVLALVAAKLFRGAWRR